jgi:hypothetical protein
MDSRGDELSGYAAPMHPHPYRHVYTSLARPPARPAIAICKRERPPEDGEG